MLAPTAANADEFHGTRSEQLIERDHEIDITLDRGHATLRVRRTVFNGGERHDQATFWIDVPEASVATGLRTLGAWQGKPRWFDGELMEAEAAAAKYRELTGLGGYYPKDPALLSWRRDGLLALQVFPCPPNQRKTVEYTLTVPAEYDAGRYHLTLDPIGTPEIAASIVLRPAHAGDQIFVDGETMSSGTRLAADRHYQISLGARDMPTIHSQLAVVSTGDRYLVRHELALAPKLSTIPKHAAIVVVIDTSISIDPETLAAQLAATRAYLSHFADPRLHARAEVLTFDRQGHPLHGRLRSVAQVLADLDGFSPTQRNGSHVDAALDKATELLKGTRKDARRIVVLSDTRMRSELTPQRVAAATKGTRAVVHIGLVAETGAASVTRDDGQAWSEAALVTGGLLWDAEASTDASDTADMDSVYLEWARPIRIHNPSVLAPGLVEDELLLPETLLEGFGLATTVLQDRPVRHVILSGELWSAPMHDVAVPDHALGTRWSALVFGHELHHELREAEMMVLALRGGAVSPMTSYLAIEPGVRPSTEGLERGVSGVGSGGGGGVGFGIGRGAAFGVGQGGPTFDPDVFLATQVRGAADACGVPRNINVETDLQTTVEEIVEVERVAFVGYLDGKQRDCVRERVWAIELPGQFKWDWRRWSVTG